jgi:hypothetical protein
MCWRYDYPYNPPHSLYPADILYPQYVIGIPVSGTILHIVGLPLSPLGSVSGMTGVVLTQTIPPQTASTI